MGLAPLCRPTNSLHLVRDKDNLQLLQPASWLAALRTWRAKSGIESFGREYSRVVQTDAVSCIDSLPMPCIRERVSGYELSPLLSFTSVEVHHSCSASRVMSDCAGLQGQSPSRVGERTCAITAHVYV